jgi:hypothetical protein
LPAGIERELPLALTARGLVEANGLGDTVTILHSQVTAATVGPAPPPPLGTSSPGIHTSDGASPAAAAPPPQQQQGESEGPEAQQGAALPRRADLVVHEIFGTDPLSEHILPTMRYVQVRTWV